jgi:hypothetical protein
MAAVVGTLPLSESAVSSIFDDDDDPCNDADQELHRDEHYKAPIAGRELGVQSVPRFDMYKLRGAKGGATASEPRTKVIFQPSLNMFLLSISFL